MSYIICDILIKWFEAELIWIISSAFTYGESNYLDVSTLYRAAGANAFAQRVFADLST